MLRFIAGALMGVVMLVCNAVAEPTVKDLQESARWSVELQTALQTMMEDIGLIEDYIVVMDRFSQEDLSEADAETLIREITSTLNQSVAAYVSALEAMPPHPMPDEPLGKAMADIRQQMIGQSSLFGDFFERLESLSLRAVDGDAEAVDRLGGEIFRSGAFLIGTDIAMLRTQVSALDTANPLRNLNLAAINELQFTREILLAEASYRFGSSPGFSDGDLDAAGGFLSAGYREVANGRRNAAKLRTLLIEEKASLGSPDPLYDRLVTMVDTFASDWQNMEQTLAAGEDLLEMMIEGHEETETVFNDYLTLSSVLSDKMVANQLARSTLVGQ